MRAQDVNLPPAQFLGGWKEIATYLGKGVRTVQRYERHFGLPVRRPAGKPWGSVIATKRELDAWVMASPIRETFRLTTFSPDADGAAAIKDNLRKMCELRDQMIALRKEVHLASRVLRDSVHSLQGNLNLTRWFEAARPYSEFEVRDQTAQVFGLLHGGLGKRKAS